MTSNDRALHIQALVKVLQQSGDDLASGNISERDILVRMELDCDCIAEQVEAMTEAMTQRPSPNEAEQWVILFRNAAIIFDQLPVSTWKWWAEIMARVVNELLQHALYNADQHLKDHLLMTLLRLERFNEVYCLVVDGYEAALNAGDASANDILARVWDVIDLCETLGHPEVLESYCLVMTALHQRFGVANSIRVADCIYMLGQHYLQTHREEMGRQKLDEAEAIYRDLIACGASNMMQVRVNLAAVLQSTNRFAEADKQYGEVRAEFIKNGNLWTDEYGGILKQMQFNYESINNISGAIEVVRQFIDLRQAAYGNEDSTYASALCDLSLLLPKLGKSHEAIALCQDAVQILQRIHGERHESFISAFTNLGSLYEEAEDLENARLVFERVLVLCRESFGDRHMEVAYALTSLAEVRATLGDVESVHEMHEYSFRIREQIMPETSVEVAEGAAKLAASFEQLGDTKNATSYYRRALQSYAIIVGTESDEYISCHDRIRELTKNYVDDS